MLLLSIVVIIKNLYKLSKHEYEQYLRLIRCRKTMFSAHMASVYKSMLMRSVPDPWHFGVDPDPAIFVIDLQDASKKLIFNTIFSAYYFLKIHLHHFSKIKSQKESQNRGNQGFSYYFCMMIEGSGSGAGSVSGSIPLTSGFGSGSGRPKNMWIRWIRIRIRNTAYV